MALPILGCLIQTWTGSFFICVFYFYNVYGTYISLVYVLCWWCYFLTWKNSFIEVSIQFSMIFINKRSLTYVSFGKAFNSFGLKLFFSWSHADFWHKWKMLSLKHLQSLRPTQDLCICVEFFPLYRLLRIVQHFIIKPKQSAKKLATNFQFNLYNLLLICFWVFTEKIF